MTDDSRRDSELIVAWLAGRDAACPTCRYNLRDCPQPTCPECGARIVLTVDRASRLTIPYLVGVVALSSLAIHEGYHIIQFFEYLLRMQFALNPAAPTMFYVLLFGGPLVGITLGVAWMYWRERILQMRPKQQWQLAGATIIAHPAWYLAERVIANWLF